MPATQTLRFVHVDKILWQITLPWFKTLLPYKWPYCLFAEGHWSFNSCWLKKTPQTTKFHACPWASVSSMQSQIQCKTKSKSTLVLPSSPWHDKLKLSLLISPGKTNILFKWLWSKDNTLRQRKNNTINHYFCLLTERVSQGLSA